MKRLLIITLLAIISIAFSTSAWARTKEPAKKPTTRITRIAPSAKPIAKPSLVRRGPSIKPTTRHTPSMRPSTVKPVSRPQQAHSYTRKPSPSSKHNTRYRVGITNRGLSIGRTSDHSSFRLQIGMPSYKHYEPSYCWGRWVWREYAINDRVYVGSYTRTISRVYNSEWRVYVLTQIVVPGHYEYRQGRYGEWVWVQQNNWHNQYRMEYERHSSGRHDSSRRYSYDSRSSAYRSLSQASTRMRHPDQVKSINDLPKSAKPTTIPSHATKGVKLKK